MAHRHSLWSQVAAVLLCAVVLVGTPARADVWGGDVAVLSSILVQASHQVEVLTKQLDTIKNAYQETRKVAAAATDAYKTYQHFKTMTWADFGQEVSMAIDQAYPDVAYYRREAAGAGDGWGQATGGALEMQLAGCIGSAGRPGANCAQIAQNFDMSKTRDALTAAFGQGTTIVDSEAAIAVTSAKAAAQRDAEAAAPLARLNQQCTGDTGDTGTGQATGCQAAANVANIDAARTAHEIDAKLAQSNINSALQLKELEAARQKEAKDAADRRELFLHALHQTAAPPPTVKTEGIDLLGGGQ